MTPKTTKSSDNPTNRARIERSFAAGVLSLMSVLPVIHAGRVLLADALPQQARTLPRTRFLKP
jgi:hypothetical protein